MNNQSSSQSSTILPTQPVYDSGVRNNSIMPVHKRTKHDGQLDRLVSFLTIPNINGGRVILRKNLLKTKYVIWESEIIFFGEDKLIERIKAEAYFQAHEQLTDKVIKSALQIISGRTDIWHYDAEEERIIPIRTMPLPMSIFTYTFNKLYHVSNYNNYYQIRNYVPKGFIEIQSPKNHCFINEPFDNDYQSSFNFSVLKEIICKQANISEDYFLIVLTWLVQSIASDNYTLLELIGESKTGKSSAQAVLRELIDPNVELMTKAPKKLTDLQRQTMDGHIMSFDEVEKLYDEVQLFMVDLMSVNGAKITYPVSNKEYNAEIFVRHPIILNSVMPVVTHEKLLNKTLTIEMNTPKERGCEHKMDKMFFHNARLELLKLTKKVCDFSSPDLPKCTYLDLSNFSDIGLKLSKIIYRTTTAFEEQLSFLIKEQILANLEENHTSYLIYLWAIKNVRSQKEISATDWINELEAYHNERFGNWQITPKQFGSDLKRAAPTLRQLGIHCESLGKRGSFVKWKITTAETIDIQVNYFEMPPPLI